MEEWWRIANGPAIWLGGFILVGVATLGAYLMFARSRKVASRLGITDDRIKEAVKASAITAIGPSTAIVVGMLPIIVALGPGMAWLRESAGIGSIMYELATAQFGLRALGEELGPGLSEVGFATALFVMSTACLPWLIGLMVFTPIAKPVRDKALKWDPKIFPLVAVIMMLIAFGNNMAPDILKMDMGTLAITISFVCTLAVFKIADTVKKPQLKEYALTIAMLIAMFLAYIIMGGS
ncbi:MAG: hypothetical protein DRN33_03400 [Thermoplasmata archaeon]|nr:MAG: hypothetical protein DRN33_03400 [Thermoplasmata archaeon]